MIRNSRVDQASEDSTVRDELRKVMLARGGAMSPYSGLGSTHNALMNRLDSGIISGYELGDVHEYQISKNPLKRLWKRWFVDHLRLKKWLKILI